MKILKKICIFYFFENFLLKLEPSEIPPFFYNNSFGFGGGISPFPSAYAHGTATIKPFAIEETRISSGKTP